MSLLTICQNAADGIGIARPSAVWGETDSSTRILLACARHALESLGRCHPWQILIKEGSISLTSGTKTYAVPADFRELRPDTTWDRVADRSVVFPGSQEWAFINGRDISTSLNRRMRIIGDEFTLYEAPTATVSDVIYYEYITKNLVTGDKETWDADINTSVLDEWLIELSVIWRYKQRRDTPGWAEDRAFFNKELAAAKAKDSAPQTLHMGGDDRVVVGGLTLPETGYG